MFENLLNFINSILQALSGQGVKICSINFTSKEYAEVIIDTAEEQQPALEFYTYSGDISRIGVTVNVYRDSVKRAQLTFKSDMLPTEVASIFMKFINIDKLKPIVESFEEEALFIKKKYFYVKRCNKCNDRYFKNEIGKDNFEHLSSNENITIYINDPKENIAEIVSVCESCSK